MQCHVITLDTTGTRGTFFEREKTRKNKSKEKEKEKAAVPPPPGDVIDTINI